MLLFTALALAPTIGCAAPAYITSRPAPAWRLGVRLVPDAGSTITDGDRDRAIAILRARLEALGIDAPLVEPSRNASETIAIVLPSVRDPERVKRLVSAEPGLALRPVVGDSRMAVYPTAAAAREAAGFDPARHEVLPYAPPELAYESGGRTVPVTQYLVVEKEAVVVGDDVLEAEAALDEYNKLYYQINFTLRPAASERFGAWTGANIGRDLAIVLEGEVRSAPRIQSQITERGQITGRYTKEEAEDLAIVLRSGRLPARVILVSESVVAPDR